MRKRVSRSGEIGFVLDYARYLRVDAQLSCINFELENALQHPAIPIHDRFKAKRKKKDREEKETKKHHREFFFSLTIDEV